MFYQLGIVAFRSTCRSCTYLHERGVPRVIGAREFGLLGVHVVLVHII